MPFGRGKNPTFSLAAAGSALLGLAFSGKFLALISPSFGIEKYLLSKIEMVEDLCRKASYSYPSLNLT